MSPRYTLAKQGKNYLIVGNVTDRNHDSHCGLARITPEGRLDRSFGTDGKVVGPSQSFGWGCRRAYVQADRKILAVGDDLIRYDENGAIDIGFGTQGRFNYSGGHGVIDGRLVGNDLFITEYVDWPTPKVMIDKILIQ